MVRFAQGRQRRQHCQLLVLHAFAPPFVCRKVLPSSQRSTGGRIVLSPLRVYEYLSYWGLIREWDAGVRMQVLASSLRRTYFIDGSGRNERRSSARRRS